MTPMKPSGALNAEELLDPVEQYRVDYGTGGRSCETAGRPLPRTWTSCGPRSRTDRRDR
jgi:hypothetical protein